jgi:hypothetical protein
MSKLNWWRAGKLYRRPTLDWRYEHDIPDRADRWLAAVERQQAQRRQRPRERRSFSGSSQSSSAVRLKAQRKEESQCQPSSAISLTASKPA